MPTFDNRPPADADHSGYRLIRTPPAHALLAHVISENLVGCNTHFVNNRTVPCEAPDCDPCQQGIGWRWHGYLLILIDATQEVAIFETTARASAAFSAHHERYSTLRGAHFKASRINNRQNGRVLIQVKPGDLQRIKLPPPQPVEKLLCHIWNIPPVTVNKTAAKTRPPFDHARVDRLQDPDVIKIDTPATVSQGVRAALQQHQAKGNGTPPDPSAA